VAEYFLLRGIVITVEVSPYIYDKFRNISLDDVWHIIYYHTCTWFDTPEHYYVNIRGVTTKIKISKK
jgi:hypothetical protein